MNKKIELKAESLLKKYNLFDLIPIDVFSLAKSIGINFIDHKLSDDISGVLIINNGIGSIGYNSNHPIVRQRFTVAHEIGHFVLNHSREGSVFIDQPSKHMTTKLYRNSNSSSGENLQEIEANNFAASLLMPKKHVIPQSKNYSISDLTGNGIEKMAKVFNVSTQSMIFRLINLDIISSNYR